MCGSWLRNLGVPRAEREARVREMLAMIEMTDLAERLPRELSGGQQQRAALARALALRPAVLLLDEPLSNLDAQLRVRMREEIRALIRRLTMTTLFVTHDQEEALVLADRIVVMNRGRVEQVGAPDAVYERPATRFVADFIGLANLLEARVTAVEAEHVVITTARGLHLRARRESGDGTAPRVGETVTVILRPEHLAVTEASRAPGNRFRARVLTTTYLGSLSRHRLLVEGEELLMERHTANAGPLATGLDVWVAVDPGRVRVLP